MMRARQLEILLDLWTPCLLTNNMYISTGIQWVQQKKKLTQDVNTSNNTSTTHVAHNFDSNKLFHIAVLDS